jgi:hypothetical protein
VTRLVCPTCKGTGIAPGTATLRCSVCKGAGLLPNDRVNNPPCAFCQASGISPGATTIICDVCQGWGRLPEPVTSGPPRLELPQAAAIASLRRASSGISSQHAKEFIDEAIGCAEASFHRAAIVLSWVGAIRVMQEHVVTNRLSDFNTEALRRDTRWRPARTADDLSRLKEYDFLQILEAISVIGKSVKAELEGCLKLRNGCGHPSSLQVSENRTASHIESLVLNVFSKF